MHNLQLTRRTYGQRFLHQGPEIPHLSVTLPNFFFFLHTIHVSHLLLHSSDSFSNCSDYSCSFPFLSSENHVSPDVLILAVCCKVKDVCWNILLIFPPKKTKQTKTILKFVYFNVFFLLGLSGNRNLCVKVRTRLFRRSFTRSDGATVLGFSEVCQLIM